MRSSFRCSFLFLFVAIGHVSQVGAFSTLPIGSPLTRTSPPSFVTSKSNSRLRLHNYDNHDLHHDYLNDFAPLVQQQQQPLCRKQRRNRLVVSTATASAISALVVALVALPPSALALDLGGLSLATSTTTSSVWDNLIQTGFYQAFSLVFLSEIGDKTFFIAGLLAMKTSRFVSYLGSMGALAAMTILSVLIGQVFHAVPAGIAQGIPLDDVAAVLAFAFFGIKTLKEALFVDAADGESTSTMDEELADAEETVAGSDTIKQATAWAQILSTFGLVFAAEFGDRSFLSTIALSAAQNPISVAGGAIAAHGVATGIAVAGGSYVAKYISEKVIGVISGTLFLVFALTTALGIF